MNKTLLVLTVMMIISGCRLSTPKYIEGTLTNIGLYVPYNGNIYGAEILSYVNGIKADFNSNQTWKVTREYQAENSYFGIVSTQEKTKTEIETK